MLERLISVDCIEVPSVNNSLNINEKSSLVDNSYGKPVENRVLDVKAEANLPELKLRKVAQLGAHLLRTIDEIPLRRINAVDDTSIASEVRRIIADAARLGASDIHYEPVENFLLVRFRIDGVLNVTPPPHLPVAGAILSSALRNHSESVGKEGTVRRT